MGYGGQTGVLVNKENGIRYIQSDHLVGGIEYLLDENSKITVEAFYKKYNYYPFSVNDSVAIASKGGDYGTFGDEELLPIGKGRSFGVELYARHTNLFGFNTTLSYTFVRSEFLDAHGTYIPTAWDNKHLFNIIATRSFKRNWDFGFKYRFAGGTPYTPDDVEKTSYVQAWESRQRAFIDYRKFNQERFSPFRQLDIRVDKSYYFEKWSLMFYLDIQNVLNAKSDSQDILTVATDESGNKIIINPTDSVEQQKYRMRYIPTEGSGTVLASVGVIIEF